MPIDSSLFRQPHEGGNTEEVCEWQKLRCTNSETHMQACAPALDLEGMDLERRKILRDLNEKRSALKALQQSLAPRKGDVADNSFRVVEEARAKVKGLKSVLIPHAVEKHQEITTRIEKTLQKVANSVDTLLCIDDDDASLADTPLLDRDDVKQILLVSDPLFCLGGYETIIMDDDSDTRKVTVLTGIGAALFRALSVYSTSFLREQGTDSSSHLCYQLVHLPESLPVSASVLHSFWGCRPITSSCAVCRAISEDPSTGHQQQDAKAFINLLEAPSIIAFSTLHQKKIYWDRQLPSAFVGLTSNRSTVDERDTNRGGFSSSTSGKKSRGGSWIERCSNTEQIELFVLIVSNLSESRKVQKQMVGQIMTLHQSLLLGDITGCTTNQRNDARRKSIVRSRVVSPTGLLPCEASRMVVEGYLPSTQSYIELGFVSNFTDYLSRGCKTKCGGMDVEFVHTVHGKLCKTAQTVDWFIQNNVVTMKGGGGEELGVGLPISLVPHFMCSQIGLDVDLDGTNTTNPTAAVSFLFLPFQRRLRNGKNGKVAFEEISSSSRPRLVQAKYQKIGDGTVRPRMQTIKSKDLNAESKKKKPFALDRMPTKQEIRDEASCSPYGFLPIGL